jgi:hypothetical protein
MRMHRPDYLKAKKQIQTLNRSIAQRERRLLWTDSDKLEAMYQERTELQLAARGYEQWYMKVDNEFDREFWASSPAIDWAAA